MRFNVFFDHFLNRHKASEIYLFYTINEKVNSDVIYASALK